MDNADKIMESCSAMYASTATGEPANGKPNCLVNEMQADGTGGHILQSLPRQRL